VASIFPLIWKQNDRRIWTNMDNLTVIPYSLRPADHRSVSLCWASSDYNCGTRRPSVLEEKFTFKRKCEGGIQYQVVGLTSQTSASYYILFEKVRNENDERLQCVGNELRVRLGEARAYQFFAFICEMTSKTHFVGRATRDSSRRFRLEKARPAVKSLKCSTGRT
jgi:hypothetical protein